MADVQDQNEQGVVANTADQMNKPSDTKLQGDQEGEQQVAVQPKQELTCGQKLKQIGKYALDYLITGGSGSVAIDELTWTAVLVNLLPNIINHFIYLFVNVVFQHYVGLEDENHPWTYTSYYLGNGFNYVIWFYISYGFVQAMAVVCPPYFSEKKFVEIGCITNITRYYMIIWWVIYLAILFTCPRKYLSWVMDIPDRSYGADILDDAELFCRVSCVGMLFEVLFEAECKYCQAHLRYGPNLHSIIVSIILSAITGAIFLKHYKMGILGAAIAYDITEFLKFVWIFLENWFVQPYPESHFYFCRKEIYNKELWKICLRNGLLVGIVYFAEMLGFYISGVLAYRLEEDSTQYDLYQCLNDIYNTIYCLSTASNTYITLIVAYLIGLGRKEDIKKTIIMSTLFVEALSIICWCFFCGFSENMAKFFSEDPKIYKNKELLADNFYQFAIDVADITQNIFGGSLRGLGYMLMMTFTGIIVFTGFMNLLSWILSFKVGMDVQGILLSELIAYVIETILYLCWLIFVVDYDKIYHDILESNKKIEEEQRKMDAARAIKDKPQNEAIIGNNQEIEQPKDVMVLDGANQAN